MKCCRRPSDEVEDPRIPGGTTWSNTPQQWSIWEDPLQLAPEGRGGPEVAAYQQQQWITPCGLHQQQQWSTLRVAHQPQQLGSSWSIWCSPPYRPPEQWCYLEYGQEL